MSKDIRSKIFFSNKIEKMGQTVSKKNINYPPISGNNAMDALRNSEKLDGYRSKVASSSSNRIARKTIAYIPSIHTISKEIEPSEVWPNGQVIWMDPISDMGLPHTRPPRYICLPSNLSTTDLKDILVHERIHLSQRQNAKEWLELMKSWSMEPWEGTIHSDILMRKRLNPDLLLSPTFSWKKEWVPLALFKSLNTPNLPDVDVTWWHIPSRTLHREAPPGWEDYFGKVDSGHEHPYELAAYLIERNINCKAHNDLKLRLKEIININRNG
jgi:hypothetical protein